MARRAPAKPNEQEASVLPEPRRLTFAGCQPDKESAIDRCAVLIEDSGKPCFWFKRSDTMYELFQDCG